MASDKAATRRRYSDELKAQVMAECDAPGCLGGQGGDVARHQRQRRAPLAATGARRRAVTVASAHSEFVPVALAAAAASQRRARHRSRAAPRRRDDEDHLAGVGRGRLRRPGCASCCGDPRRRGVAGRRAAGHACRHRGRAGPRGQRLRRCAAAPRLPVRQPPRQPHEGARARRHRRVAGRAAAEPAASSSGPRTPARR